MYARICSIADVFDALTTSRPYRRAMNTFQALQLMRGEMSGHFEPEFLGEYVKIFAGDDA